MQLELNIDQGTLWLVMQVLRRNGQPDADITTATKVIIEIVRDAKDTDHD